MMNRTNFLISSNDIDAPIMTVDFLLQFIKGYEYIKVVYEPLSDEDCTVLYFGTVKDISPSVLYFSVFSISPIHKDILLIEVDKI